MIPLMRNAFLEEDATKRALAAFICETSRLSMGEKCLEFEAAFATYQGRREAVLVNSGASANLAMLQALKNLGRLKEGDRVGFSALTWSTNTMPIIQMGFEPVPLDCDPRTLNTMSHNLLDRFEQVELKAFFATNVLGFAGDLDRIAELCEKRGIIVLEDNCEALGSELASGKTGNFSVASSFSFFVGHHMSTIEGGMICTDDAELGDMLRIVRANGWDRNLAESQRDRIRKQHAIASEFEAKYTFYDLGFNLRPTEITGFLGVFQLQFLKDNVRQREANYKALDQSTRRNPELISIDYAHLKRLSSFAIPVVCRTPQLREKYYKRFSDADVEIRPMIAGNMQRQPFYSKYVRTEYSLPGADFFHRCALYCGNYPDLTGDDLAIIADCLSG